MKSLWCRSQGLVALAAVCASGTLALGTGADVIVGELPDVTNWTTSAPINGLRAYSIGTTSCNLGDTPLNWISNTAEHPVIGQGIYRLSNGRFEQLGQSWLKHGFTALQGTVCSPCTAYPNGTHLGVGCSDPYGSGLNGSQGNLGPKSEVNATTGVYPYPYINQGTGSGALFKRTQVLDSEMGTAGALYFYSGMYISHDDTLAGNQYNNQSFRRFTVGAAPAKDLTLQGPTVRARTVIYAWQDHGLGVNTPDPGVAITQAQAPNDGRFYVGSRARSVDTGVWRYEYAVQNYNSDRSGRSFSVPIPAGAVVTNAGFRGLPWHSGEPYNATPWTITISSTEVRWECADAYNAGSDTANAMRWDSIFNFYFDCNFGSDNGSGTLGLHKPGQAGDPNSLAVGIRVPSVNGSTRPDNDDYLFASPVSAGATTFTTVGATTDGQDQPTSCATLGSTQCDHDVWFRYTSAGAGDTTISLCGSSFDTKLFVYPGTSNPTDGSAPVVACNDDDPLCPSGDARQSRLSFTASAGTTYFVRVGGRGGASGSGTMTITAPGGGPVIPANDACAAAQWLGDGTAVLGSTSQATNDGTGTCGASAASADVWYKYQPLVSGVVTFDTCGSTLDTTLAIFTTCGGAQVACNDDALVGTCAGSNQSLAAINATGGTTYLIRVAGYNSQRGAFTIRATGGGGVVPPSNDECTGRVALPLGTTNFSTLAAGTSSPAVGVCGVGGFSNDIWYNVNADGGAGSRVTVWTTGANFDARLAIYDGAGCANFDTRTLACGNGGGNDARVSSIAYGVQNSTLRVGGGGNSSGTGVLHVSVGCIMDLDDGSGNGIPDGGVTIDDLLFFLAAYEGGDVSADIDDDGVAPYHPDGAVTIDDLLSVLQLFPAGC